MRRRSFIQQACGISLCLPALARTNTTPYLREIGLQLYTLRKAIAENLPKTLDEVEKIFHIRYHTTLIAYDLVLETLRDISLGTVNFIPQTKFGRYYSFMPLDLKRIAEKKFIKFKK